MDNPKSVPYTTDFQHLLPCEKSPTKAHHWMLPGEGAEVQGPCRYCGAMSRKFQATYGASWYTKELGNKVTIRRLVKQDEEK